MTYCAGGSYGPFWPLPRGDTCKSGLHWYEWGPLTVNGFSYMACMVVLVAPSADSFWSPGHSRVVATWLPLQSHVPGHFIINQDSSRSDERFERFSSVGWEILILLYPIFLRLRRTSAHISLWVGGGERKFVKPPIIVHYTLNFIILLDVVKCTLIILLLLLLFF